MKTFLLSVFFLAFAFFHVQGQEIVNPSFNVPDNTPGYAAKGWIKDTNRIWYDTVNAHSGAGCIYIYNSDYLKSICRQRLAFNPGGLKKYRMKIFIKTESRKGYACAYVKTLDANGKFINQYNLPEGMLTGKKRWQQYEVEFQATADVRELEIGFYYLDKGKAWFDDVTIEPVADNPKEVPQLAKDYIGEVHKILKKQCWYADSVNLDEIVKNALPLAGGAKNKSDCFEAIAYIFDRLGDPSGRFYDPATARNWWKEQKINDEQPIYPIAKRLENDYIHIYLPGVTAMDRTVLKRYADTLHQQLTALGQSHIKGWVVDLRENVGGNATAMLAAIGPLLNKNPCGKYIRSKTTVSWNYRNGQASIDTTKIKVDKPYTAPKPDLPVAVLTSQETYGAGELILVAFSGREKTKTFGEPTVGATVNEKRITLSDGSMMFFTAGIMCDNWGRIYNGKIKPDVPVRLIYTEDHCLGKAMKWLKEQK